MARAQDDGYVQDGYIVTCEFSNDISIPWVGKTKFKKYKNQSSSDMLNQEKITPDLVLIDGRL